MQGEAQYLMIKELREKLLQQAVQHVRDGKARSGNQLWQALGKDRLSRSTAWRLYGEAVLLLAVETDLD